MIKLFILTLVLCSRVYADSILLKEYDNTYEGKYDAQVAQVIGNGVQFSLLKKVMGFSESSNGEPSRWTVIRRDEVLSETFLIPEIQILPMPNTRNNQKIVYQILGEEEIVCVNIKQPRFFPNTFSFNETGNCSVEIRKLFINDLPKIQVYLHLKR